MAEFIGYAMSDAELDALTPRELFLARAAWYAAKVQPHTVTADTWLAEDSGIGGTIAQLLAKQAPAANPMDGETA